METIRNYLESMFKNLPQTEAVIKAKYELGQMMEDKYYELIKEGKSESEAVGTVISEFGNLEELAGDLGIDEVFKKTKTTSVNRRKITLDEVKAYLATKKISAILIAIGVALCISCVTGPIIANAFNWADALVPSLLFIILAAGIACFIVSKSKMEEWSFINEQACSLEGAAIDYVKNKKRDYMSTYSILVSVGVLLCVFCIVPPIIINETYSYILDELSGAFFFWFISAGVALIVVAKKIKTGYLRLLQLNNVNPDDIYWQDDKPYVKGVKTMKYKNSTQKLIIDIFWPSVTCIYLSWSFLTYDWHITWIIWPIAGVVCSVLKHLFEEENNEGDE